MHLLGHRLELAWLLHVISTPTFANHPQPYTHRQMSNYLTHFRVMASEGLFTDAGLARLLRALLPRVK